MYTVLQRLTKFLSIKTIVILGVVIMATIIVAFGFTMTYLSSTIKYDQTTLKYILELEKQNQSVLNIIKDVNYLNNKILITQKHENLQGIEEELLDEVTFTSMKNISKQDYFIKEYNDEISNFEKLFNEIIDIQKSMYSSKNTILFFEKELNNHKNKVDNFTELIANETELIYGKASLLTKRYNKKLSETLQKDGSNILRDTMFRDLGSVITIGTDLYVSIVKLPNLVNEVINTKNQDLVTSINKNNLTQLTLLVENSLLKLNELSYLEPTFSDSVSLISKSYSDVMNQVNFLIIIKQQLLKEENLLSMILEKNKNVNSSIYNKIETLNNISNSIKLETLNHSDSISKKTTVTILVVGLICLILLTIAATTLISRINVPLEFMIKFMDSIIGRKRKLSSKLPITTNDEFGKLSRSFNEMTSTISNNIQEIKHLNKEIEDTQKEVIFTMGAIGESRSKETGNHVKRVAEYSKIFALKYGLDMEIAELLKEASPMHDIGKVGIPDAVLKKPGPLDDIEWDIMKTHAKLGYEMLKHSHRDILQAAAIVAYEHHEKWDGSGYPRGLKGEEIHIYGRITAVADVFDALGSDRCYKKAWPLDDIKKFFKDNKGTHFEPKLVDIFFENIDEFIYIRDMYKDSFD